MKDYIEITKVVTERVPLTREPTQNEIAMIRNDEMFDIEEKLIDWDSSEIVGEDYSYAKIEIRFDGTTLFYRSGKY